MKKKWLIYVAVALVLFLIAAAVIIHFWFESAGVRSLGGDLHAELSGKCYIIDPETGEIIDETTIHINGSTSSSDSGLFEGELNVVGYQNTESGTLSSTMGVEQEDHGYWSIRHIQTCTHRETVDGITKDEEHICNYEYVYYVKPGVNDYAIVRIEPFDGDLLFAIHADTEAEALQRYEEFSSNQP